MNHGKRFRSWILGIGSALALSGCGGTANTPALQVTNVTPADGYHGFRHGDVIVVEFSAPVDLNSFLSAYRSTSDGLLPCQIRYRLSDGGKRLTIYPGHDLAYSPDDTYRYFGFEIGTELADLDGRHLAEPLRVTFSTLRTLTVRLPGEAALDGSVGNGTAVTDQGAIIVGDNLNDQPVRGFLSFEVPEEVGELLGGTLYLTPAALVGNPRGDLAPFQLEWVDYGEALDPGDFSAAALSAAPITDPRTWIPDAPLSYDVGDWIQSASERGLARLQFRLQFGMATDQDGASDAVFFYATEASGAAVELRPGLELVYYGP